MPKFQPLSRSVGVVIPEQRPLGSIGVVNPKGRKVSSILLNPQIEENKQRLQEKRDITSTAEGMRNLPDIQPVENLSSNYRRPVGKTATSNVQTALKKYDPSIEVDGVWGPKTEDAYRKYWGTYTQEVQARAQREQLLMQQEAERQAQNQAQMQNAHNLYMESMGYNAPAWNLPTDVIRPYAPPITRTINQDATRAESLGLSLADYYDEQDKARKYLQYDPSSDKFVPTRAAYEEAAKEIAKNKKQEWDKFFSKNGVPAYRGTDNTLSPLEDFSKYTDEQLAAYLQSNGQDVPNFSGTIRELKDEDIYAWSDEDRPWDEAVSHWWEMLKHPFTAIEQARGTQKEFMGIPYTDYDVPDNFYELNKGMNPLDFASAIVNPFQYISAAGRLGKKALTHPIDFITDPAASVGYGLGWLGSKGLDLASGPGHEFANQAFMESARNSGMTDKALQGLGEIGDVAFVFDPAIGSYMRSFHPALDLASQGSKALQGLKPFTSADYAKGYFSGAFPSAVNRISNKIINPKMRPLAEVERQTLDDVDKLFKLLYDNNVLRGRPLGDRISKTALNNITSDAGKLAEMQQMTSRLHPSVVEQIMGKENFKEFGQLFKYNPEGLSGQTIKQEIMFKMGSKFPGLKVKTPRGSAEYNQGYKKGVELFSKPFIENSQLDEIATGLIPLVKYSEGKEKMMEALREGMNKLDAADVGEILSPSGSLSFDSYELSTKSIAKKIEQGLVKYHDYEMAPMNSMSFAHNTKSESIIEKGLIDLNRQIKQLSKTLGHDLPPAYFDVSKEMVIAPYVLVEKIAEPTKVLAEVQWKEGAKTLSEWRYIGKDGKGLKAGESIKSTKKNYTPRFKKETQPANIQ